MKKSEIKGGSLAYMAYDAIKDAIYDGQFVPGDMTSELQLSKMLNMSRTPIHNAVQRLEREGFIEFNSNSGIRIKGVSYNDIQNFYKLRIVLEILASETAILHISDKELNEIEKELHKAGALHDVDVDQARELFLCVDMDIHRMLIDRCENSYIQDVKEIFYSNIQRYQRLSVGALNDLPESIMWHLKIIDCIRHRDQEEVARILKMHLEWGKHLIIPEQLSGS